MSNRHGHPRYYELLKEIEEIHNQKNSDYSMSARGGDPLSNFKRSEELGVLPWVGCLIRLTDKYSRVVELSRKIQQNQNIAVTDEKFEDTLKDLANYALITIILYEEWKKKQTEEMENKEGGEK